MNSLRINRLTPRQIIKLVKHAHAESCSGRRADYPEMVATVTYMDTKTFFDLPKVLVKLTTQVRQQIVIGGLQQKFPGFYSGVQEWLTDFVLVMLNNLRRPRTQDANARVMNFAMLQ